MLEHLLKKLGVTSTEELTTEELATYNAWKEALAGRKLTDEDVGDFLHRELDKSITLLVGNRLGERDDTFLKMKVEFIRAVIEFLDGPRREQEAIKKQITSQLT